MRGLSVLGRQICRFSALLLMAMMIGVLPALAATVDFSIPIDTVVTGVPGSERVLAVVDVPVESQGETCDVSAVARNQGSEHPDSNLLISSATSVEILDVENTAHGTVFGGGLITLAETVTVTLTFGPDGVLSGGLDVEIDCPPFATTTTTVAPTTTAVTAQETTTSVLAIVVTTSPTSGETLPFTGDTATTGFHAAGLLLLAGGIGLLAAARRSHGKHTADSRWE